MKDKINLLTLIHKINSHINWLLIQMFFTFYFTDLDSASLFFWWFQPLRLLFWYFELTLVKVLRRNILGCGKTLYLWYSSICIIDFIAVWLMGEGWKFLDNEYDNSDEDDEIYNPKDHTNDNQCLCGLFIITRSHITITIFSLTSFFDSFILFN